MQKRTKCQCDINGSPKQWCQRHQSYKSPIEVRQCQISIPKFVEWENCRGAGQSEDCAPVPLDKDEMIPGLLTSSLGNAQSYVDRSKVAEQEKAGCSSCGKNKLAEQITPRIDTSSLDTKEQQQNAPNMMSMGWSFAKAVGSYVKSGMKNLNEENYAERMLICDTCEWRSGGRCMKCGCFIDKKAGWASADCPIGKWPKVNQ
jgi:hypothetical protein